MNLSREKSFLLCLIIFLQISIDARPYRNSIEERNEPTKRDTMDHLSLTTEGVIVSVWHKITDFFGQATTPFPPLQGIKQYRGIPSYSKKGSEGARTQMEPLHKNEAPEIIASPKEFQRSANHGEADSEGSALESAKDLKSQEKRNEQHIAHANEDKNFQRTLGEQQQFSINSQEERSPQMRWNDQERPSEGRYEEQKLEERSNDVTKLNAGSNEESRVQMPVNEQEQPASEREQASAFSERRSRVPSNQLEPSKSPSYEERKFQSSNNEQGQPNAHGFEEREQRSSYNEQGQSNAQGFEDREHRNSYEREQPNAHLNKERGYRSSYYERDDPNAHSYEERELQSSVNEREEPNAHGYEDRELRSSENELEDPYAHRYEERGLRSSHHELEDPNAHGYEERELRSSHNELEDSNAHGYERKELRRSDSEREQPNARGFEERKLLSQASNQQDSSEITKYKRQPNSQDFSQPVAEDFNSQFQHSRYKRYAMEKIVQDNDHHRGQDFQKPLVQEVDDYDERFLRNKRYILSKTAEVHHEDLQPVIEEFDVGQHSTNKRFNDFSISEWRTETFHEESDPVESMDNK